MKKLKNVLNGYLAVGIEMLNIIDISKMEIPFCGTVESFRNPPDFMRDYQRDLLNSEVKKSVENGVRLDVFI